MRTNSSLLILCIATSLLACTPSEPPIEPATSTAATASEPATPDPEPAKTDEPATPDPEPATPDPEPATPDPGGCQVQLMLEAEGANGKLAKPVTLRASAKNLTDAPLELKLRDVCPGGEAQFSGLEPANEYYDYYGTCAMGACAPGRPPRVIALPPGEIVEISSTTIDPNGEKPCSDPLAAGTYKLSFSLAPAEGSSLPVLCGPEPLELRRK